MASESKQFTVLDGAQQFHCQSCNVLLSGEINITSHLNGRKHKNAMGANAFRARRAVARRLPAPANYSMSFPFSSAGPEPEPSTFQLSLRDNTGRIVGSIDGDEKFTDSLAKSMSKLNLKAQTPEPDLLTRNGCCVVVDKKTGSYSYSCNICGGDIMETIQLARDHCTSSKHTQTLNDFMEATGTNIPA